MKSLPTRQCGRTGRPQFHHAASELGDPSGTVTDFVPFFLLVFFFPRCTQHQRPAPLSGAAQVKAALGRLMLGAPAGGGADAATALQQSVCQALGLEVSPALDAGTVDFCTVRAWPRPPGMKGHQEGSRPLGFAGGRKAC